MKKLFLAPTLLSAVTSKAITWLAKRKHRASDELTSMLMGLDQPIPPMFVDSSTARKKVIPAGERGFGQFILQNAANAI